MARFPTLLSAVGLLLPVVSSITVDLTSSTSVLSAAAEVAHGMVGFIVGNTTAEGAGALQYPPYYWWETGAMLGVVVNYWAATNDSSFNNQVEASIVAQIGTDKDFEPVAQYFDMGNDDQAFWAMTAMTAAETNFQNPSDKTISWLGLTQAVFNEQILRWNTSSCNGGIRWQVFPSGGFHLKNSISNGALMQIAARLARYTKDDTYADWATKIWDWMWSVKLIDNVNYSVYDNADAGVPGAELNCTSIDRSQWTYNAGTVLVSAATMYNYTGSDVWKNRTQQILTTILYDFFPTNNIMIELCEKPPNSCNVDQQTFKTYLARWMAVTVQMAPFTEKTIMPVLQASAKAAMLQCSGNGAAPAPLTNACGMRWTNGATWDGSSGPGQQMAALSVLLSTIIAATPAPLTNSTGGTSVSDPTAGTNKTDVVPGTVVTPATTGGRVGAWILTILLIGSSVVGCYFLWSPSWEMRPSSPYSTGPALRTGFFASMSGGLGSSAKAEKTPGHMGGLMSG